VNNKIKGGRILAVIAILLLIAAVLGRWPYGFYTLLRLFVCGTSAYLAFVGHTAKNNIWRWLMGALAILFNPIVPIHLSRSNWQYLDVLAAIALLVFVALDSDEASGLTRGTIVLLAFFAGVYALGKVLRVLDAAFRPHPLIFLGLTLPLLWVAARLSTAHRKYVKGVTIGVALLLGLLFLTDAEFIRDLVGHRFVAGYSVQYVQEYDDDGQEVVRPQIATTHWYGRVGLTVFWLGYLVFCVAVPLATWLLFRMEPFVSKPNPEEKRLSDAKKAPGGRN